MPFFKQIKLLFRTWLHGNGKSLPPYEKLHAALLRKNVTPTKVLRLIEELKASVSEKNEFWKELFCAILIKHLPAKTPLFLEKQHNVIFILGENGQGKTTFCAKLANYFLSLKKSVSFIAADTFRAGAKEQLRFWADLLQIPCFKEEGTKTPASVVFMGLKESVEANQNIILIDTHGALHTNINLMNSLQKSISLALKFVSEQSLQKWLVLDASMGVTLLEQMRGFHNQFMLSGILLTKMENFDGIIFSLHEQVKTPILFLGYGESLKDLVPFDPEDFSKAFLEKLELPDS